jgi:hypothetical protein
MVVSARILGLNGNGMRPLLRYQGRWPCPFPLRLTQLLARVRWTHHPRLFPGSLMLIQAFFSRSPLDSQRRSMKVRQVAGMARLRGGDPNARHGNSSTRSNAR